ncbi:AT hook motif protein [Teratosphaeria destructans]|uniref:AT hook motif protein n=1 Tax=Teratosphaeria destructans TaxID=418781 RepID=A0A9W7SLG7_9PEZI|nr:AT hook motif protein [Teratosphaeria destructans]
MRGRVYATLSAACSLWQQCNDYSAGVKFRLVRITLEADPVKLKCFRTSSLLPFQPLLFVLDIHEATLSCFLRHSRYLTTNSQVRKMPITWDAAMDQKLLLAILKTHAITLDHTAVATELGATPMAIQKRIQKIRETIKKGGSDVGTPKNKTGGKRKSGGPFASKKNKGTPKSNKKAAAAAEDDEEDFKVVKQEPGDLDEFSQS